MLTRRLLVGGGGAVVARAALAQSTNGTGGERAPFGLTWGQAAEEIEASGVTLTPAGGATESGVAFQAAGLTATLPDSEVVTLYFGLRNRLWRIFAVGRAMGPDPYGFSGLRRYQDLIALLTGRYGEGHDVDERRTFSQDPARYVYYLTAGQAKRYTEFQGGGAVIQLSLHGYQGDMTRWALLYDGIREAAAFRIDKTSQEINAL